MIAPTSDEDNNDNSNAPSLIQIASIIKWQSKAVHFSALVILLLLKSEKKIMQYNISTQKITDRPIKTIATK